MHFALIIIATTFIGCGRSAPYSGSFFFEDSPWVAYNATTVTLRPSKDLYSAKFLVDKKTNLVDHVHIVSREHSPIPGDEHYQDNNSTKFEIEYRTLEVAPDVSHEEGLVVMGRGPQNEFQIAYQLTEEGQVKNVVLIKDDFDGVQTRGVFGDLIIQFGKLVLRETAKLIIASLDEKQKFETVYGALEVSPDESHAKGLVVMNRGPANEFQVAYASTDDGHIQNATVVKVNSTAELRGPFTGLVAKYSEIILKSVARLILDGFNEGIDNSIHDAYTEDAAPEGQ